LAISGSLVTNVVFIDWDRSAAKQSAYAIGVSFFNWDEIQDAIDDKATSTKLTSYKLKQSYLENREVLKKFVYNQ
jgi:hypothetical protein